jgi:hypothetical protein
MTEPLPTMTAYKNTETAPIVFFDGPIAWGTYAGVIQIELGARCMSATTDGEHALPAAVEVHVAARLRCSPSAARKLRDAIDKTLTMLDRPQDAAAAVVGKLN